MMKMRICAVFSYIVWSKYSGVGLSRCQFVTGNISLGERINFNVRIFFI
jgi:hypothetical protein